MSRVLIDQAFIFWRVNMHEKLACTATHAQHQVRDEAETDSAYSG